jgi:hypothetical protein
MIDSFSILEVWIWPGFFMVEVVFRGLGFKRLLGDEVFTFLPPSTCLTRAF